MKSGAILAFASGTKKQELFDTMADRYTILKGDKVLYQNLTQTEYFDRIEDLSIEYYQTGSPNPSELTTKIIGEHEWLQNQKSD